MKVRLLSIKGQEIIGVGEGRVHTGQGMRRFLEEVGLTWVPKEETQRQRVLMIV